MEQREMGLTNKDHSFIWKLLEEEVSVMNQAFRLNIFMVLVQGSLHGMLLPGAACSQGRRKLRNSFFSKSLKSGLQWNSSANILLFHPLLLESCLWKGNTFAQSMSIPVTSQWWSYQHYIREIRFCKEFEIRRRMWCFTSSSIQLLNSSILHLHSRWHHRFITKLLSFFLSC